MLRLTVPHLNIDPALFKIKRPIAVLGFNLGFSDLETLAYPLPLVSLISTLIDLVS